MRDGMQYDSIQGQEPFKVGNPPFTMGAGIWPLIHKLGHNI